MGTNFQSIKLYDLAIPLLDIYSREIKTYDHKACPLIFIVCTCVSHSIVSNSFATPWTVTPCNLRLLCLWNSPGKNIGVDSHSLPQGIFLTQGSKPGLLHCRQILWASWVAQIEPQGAQIVSKHELSEIHSIILFSYNYSLYFS